MAGNVPNGLEALWQNVLGHWDEPGAHDAFLKACHDQEQLGYAAARYRAVIDGDDDRRKALAHKRIGAVALLATHVLEGSHEEPRTGPPRWLTVAAAVLTASAIGWLIYALMR